MVMIDDHAGAVCARFRARTPDTWLHPLGARKKGARLYERLAQRLRRRGLFLTLTYDRTAYESPRDLYERAREERHVRRFIERLGKALGESLSGRWVRKLEFQAGGWVHWHLLIDRSEPIPHEVLTRCWGRGHCWVSYMTKRRLRYFAKYVAKELEHLPGWLLVERRRSVKVVAASPGFWDDTEPSGVSSPKRPPGCWYVTVGQMLERAGPSVVVERCGRLRTQRCALGTLLFCLGVAGAVLRRGADGWWEVRGLDAAAFAEAVARAERHARPAHAEPAQRAGVGLHLNHAANPPPVPRWLQEFALSVGEAEWRRVA